MMIVPGPSRMLRPELPNRYEPVGTTTKALRSNHLSTVGLSTEPLAMRSGRVASPLAKFTVATRGVKGCPLYIVLVPANCQSRPSQCFVNCGDQMKLPAKVWPMSKSERPRSSFRLRESCACEKLNAIVPPVLDDSSMDFAQV